MQQPTVVVYAGPTIGAAEIRDILPHAVLRPPAARGDLLADEWRPGDVAVIIDGYFRERRSLGHKEVLHLLSLGVDVVGAASMGALRAAELGPCGMRGHGEVYRMYASGEIDGDDEVGVLHGPAAMGYPAQTVALVNLRYAVRAAVRDGLVGAASGERIVAAAKTLPFTFRTWSDIGRDLAEDERGALTTLAGIISSGEGNLKHLDAVSALREVAAGGAVVAQVPAEVSWTGISRTQLLDRRSRREYAPGRWMSDLDVLDAARLFDQDYPDLHEAAMVGLLDGLAAAAGLTPDAYVQAKLGRDDAAEPHGADDGGALGTWLTETERAEVATVRRLRLVMTRVWPVWQSLDWRPAVLAELRSSQRWAEWCDIVARADEVAEETRYRLVVPPPALCGKIFLRHWQRPGSSPSVELARRGFASQEELGGAVRRFFAYDVQRGRGRVLAGSRSSQ